MEGPDTHADLDLKAAQESAVEGGHPLASVDHEVITDLSAYTVHRGQWRLGLVQQDFGVVERASVGTTAALWAFGVANGHAKVTAVDTARVDVAVKGGFYRADLERLAGVPGGSARYVPLGWTASARLSPRGTLHGGTDHVRLHMEGSLGADEIGTTLSLLTGTDFDSGLFEVLGEDSGVYASTDLSLSRLRLAYDHRLGPKHSLLVTMNQAMRLGGSVTAGSTVEVAGQPVAVGATSDVTVPLAGALSPTFAVGWQYSGKRLRTRVGLPLSSQANMVLGVGSVVQLEVLLGPVGRGDATDFGEAFPGAAG